MSGNTVEVWVVVLTARSVGDTVDDSGTVTLIIIIMTFFVFVFWFTTENF